MSGDERADQPRVKRMRKGTKSCAECRRRKIKCIYEETRPDVCRDCFERGSECINQEHAQLAEPRSNEAGQSLRGRVSQLEDLVRTLVGKLDQKVSASPASGARYPDSVDGGRRASSPIPIASYRSRHDPFSKIRWPSASPWEKEGSARDGTDVKQRRKQQQQQDTDARADLGRVAIP